MNVGMTACRPIVLSKQTNQPLYWLLSIGCHPEEQLALKLDEQLARHIGRARQHVMELLTHLALLAIKAKLASELDIGLDELVSLDISGA